MRRAVATACRLAHQCKHVASIPQLACTIAVVTGPRGLELGHEAALARTWALRQAGRAFSSTIDVAKEVDAVNELFAAARDEIEIAQEDAETVYFNDSVQEARRAVEACLGRWEALLAALPEAERARVVRSMGLKMSQLQAEYDEVSKLHLED
ncbi:hypothetical protein Agub_g1770 [Astrephomene gubernaculifera]|uniref:Uncharacterized protein n=1 Tax=Astrephomene gubernaculifera TaxID=47775 RepID=A0AAD3DH46_9CHLO|nr:hypothetical protein Agub_g1770 [Astrephomene gubernaculifera]